MVWRLMMGKLPTGENLKHRGCNLPSMCSLCCKTEESSFHLFFECIYAVNIWCWLASLLNMSSQFQSMEDIWNLYNRFSNLQCKLVINSATINILNSIWYDRNQRRFKDKLIHWKSSISNILANVSLARNISTTISISMSDFTLLKKFNVMIHRPRNPKIIEVIWHPPIAQ